MSIVIISIINIIIFVMSVIIIIRMTVQENMASGTSSLSDIPLVHIHHFEQALQRVAPSVSKKDQRVYDALRWQLRSSRSHLNPQVSP